MSTATSILESPRLPGRLDSSQTARILGFGEHDIAVMVKTKLLKPLGDPARNAPKYFATCEILRLAEDRDWLHKATRAVSRHWQEKNARGQKGKEGDSQGSALRRAA